MILDILLREVCGIVASPHVFPDTQMLGRTVNANGVLLADVVGVDEVVNTARIVDERPQRDRTFLGLELKALSLTVEEEGTELTRVDVLVQREEESLVELKDIRVLLHDLVDAIQPENEDGRTLLILGIAIILAETATELVTKRAPLLLHEHLKALKCTVIRIQHQLRTSNHLCSTIPTITMND